MTPPPQEWLDRLVSDSTASTVAVVGYAGADVDLRLALRHALGASDGALWFCRPGEETTLERRFAGPLRTGKLRLHVHDRPDLAALSWAAERGLTRVVSERCWELARQPPRLVQPRAAYRANDLLRARLLDDFGKGPTARKLYGRALRLGPHRGRALRALYSSGLIHGAAWRGAMLTTLDVACSLPIPWRWPHRHRQPYLTWNVPPDRRLAELETSLARVGDDPELVLAAANAAKEVSPGRAVELGRKAQRAAIARDAPADAAWATFTLSLALRWLGQIDAAAEQADRLADGYDALAGPVWIGWGHFEQGAVTALRGDLTGADEQLQVAAEIFAASGSPFLFDACCGSLAVHRARGDKAAQRTAYAKARRLLNLEPGRLRFKREVLLVEEAELARQEGRLETAARMYGELTASPTVAQELLGLLGLAEVQRCANERVEAGWRALRRSDEIGFGYGQVHAAITLGLAGQMDQEAAERLIAACPYDPPSRDDTSGLLRFCQGPQPEMHLLCFP